MRHLNPDVRFFEIDGISMIGNFRNGAIIGLDSNGKDYIQHRRSVVVDDENGEPEIEAALQELGFLDFNDVEKKIEAAYVHITDRCNLHCVGCYSFVEERNEQVDLSTKQLYYIFDQLQDVGTSKVIISGGEPFLRKDLVEICKYAKEKCNIGFVTVISNGCMNKEAYLSAIPYIDELNISVDGYDEKTRFIRDEGIMPTVLNTIQQLKHLIPINLIFTLHKQNMQNMREYSDFAKSLNVRYSYSMFTVSPENPLFRDFIFDEHDLPRIVDNMVESNMSDDFEDVPISRAGLNCRNGCEAGNKLVSVAANGDVYPCHMLHTPEMKIGSLSDMQIPLRNIVFSNNNPFQKLTCSAIRECKECKYKELCGGGCRGRSFHNYKDIFSPDSYCNFIKSYYTMMMKNIKASIPCRS